MNNYVGIDLGTTNSVISSFDGDSIRIWKSPEQNDVTPSVIFFNRRGNKYVGKHAYDAAPREPDNAASLFKRHMGTSTKFHLSAVNMTKTPVECSAEVLRTLFGYLSEEIRNDKDTGIVITVPASFNQMQKDATMQAAELAGIGKFALMQEPVAAVMSVMRTRKTDGIFVIYDLGGGTLDVAIAESLKGHVNLLAHGGIAMCGGRDWDRVLVDNVIKPWLHDQFDLPDNLSSNPDYKSLMRLSAWATEKAKIELSANEEAVISLMETEVRTRDSTGKEIYLDIPLSRTTLTALIDEQIHDSIDSVRDTLTKAGLTASDIVGLVFVGGPTNYKPLRDKVSFELGISGNSDVNPMTAVSEGAALFAESIDWESESRARKSNRGNVSSSGKLEVSFNYIARTPDARAKIAVDVAGGEPDGAEFQVDSLDTGWTSGRISLSTAKTIEVPLGKNGENQFKVFVFDAGGGPIPLERDNIVITRTAATVDAIPASHSIGVEVKETLGGRTTLDSLVLAGDHLPKKGHRKFKAENSVKAGSRDSINIKIWEGEIQDPVTDNRFIGMLKIFGTDFDEGVIPAGADIECDFEMRDSGHIVLEVAIPSIGGVFRSGRNFYSRREGEIDFADAHARISEEIENVTKRLDEISKVVEDPKIDQARKNISNASRLNSEDSDSEQAQEALEKTDVAKRLLAEVRRDHLKKIRQIDLDQAKEHFDGRIREFARPTEETTFDNLVRTAQRRIDINSKEFEDLLDQMRRNSFEILWRQDWFVVGWFNHMVKSPYNFTDQARFQELAKTGMKFLQADDITNLRGVVQQMGTIQIGSASESEMLDVVNIVRR